MATNTLEAKAAKVNQIGTITTKTAKIYKTASKKSQATSVSTNDLKRSFYVRESKKADQTTYYRIEKGTTSLGWVATKDIKRTSRTLVSTQKKTMYLLGTNFASTMPATTASNQSYNLQIRRGKTVVLNRYEKIGNAYWYKGIISGTTKARWIRDNNLTNNGFVGLDLRKPSNVTTKDLQALLLSKGKSPDNILYRLAPEFIKAQASTGVNAQFMFAHAALETGWGNSTIAQYKNNLFGYQAYDTCPITCSKYFPTGEAGLKLYAEKIVNNYLTKTGAYYNGMNVLDMNVRYAMDQEWGQKIAFIMQSTKSYDAKYYSKLKSSIKKVGKATDYGSEIPANKPQPSSMVTLPSAVTGTVTASAATVHSIPYIYGARYGSYPKGKKITIKAYHHDVREFTNATGGKSRWYRIAFDGRQGWIRSDQVTTANLAFTNIDATLRDDAGTKYQQVGNAVKNTAIKLILKNDKPVTKKDQVKKIWYQAYKPGSTKTKIWIRSDLVTIFK
ncbi:hypothetical protein KSI01_27340 [Kurthia sibirica]|nr:hypothetical protein KSI01_27340 [Kurthia sibirica]